MTEAIIQIIRSPLELQAVSKELRKNGKQIGLVPTMGALHQGHLSLVEKCKSENDITIVSVFVNPLQFAPNEDFEKYPRDFETDSRLLAGAGADIIFFPTASELFPKNVIAGNGFSTTVKVDGMSTLLEGEIRPGHFDGVTTIVNILFNCSLADNAYFGQKDAQQAAIIQKMVKDLLMPVKVNIIPTMREHDGLAMSSRNIYLSAQERAEAVVLFKVLNHARTLINSGVRNSAGILAEAKKILSESSIAKIDYIRIVRASSFIDAEILSNGKYYLVIACRFGATRLLDNLFIEISGDKIILQ